MIVLTLSLPILSLAQQNDNAAQAIIDAKKDAESRRSTFHSYQFGGTATAAGIVFSCIGGSVVVVAASLYTPNPPTERFIGKSPEYIRFYTQTYQQTAKSKNMVASVSGCLFGTAINLGFLLWTKQINIRVRP